LVQSKKMSLTRPLILASKSPRRYELLKRMDLDFRVESIDVAETYPSDLPSSEVPRYLAEKKAQAYHHLLKDEILIAADTVVILGEEILGKPKNKPEAVEQFSKLSGKTHKVITGVCLLSREKMESFQDITAVTFKSLTEEEIQYYIDNYQPYDKAGAYGIQEWIGLIAVTEIRGSFFNVVGLPVHRIYEAIKVF